MWGFIGGMVFGAAIVPIVFWAYICFIADWIFGIGDCWRNWREARARRQEAAAIARDLREVASITPREMIAASEQTAETRMQQRLDQAAAFYRQPLYELGSPDPFTYVEQRMTVTGPQGPQGVRMPDTQRLAEQMQGLIRSLDQISHTSALGSVGIDWEAELERLHRENGGFAPIMPTPQSYSRDLLPGPQGAQARVPKPPPEPEAPPTERQPRGIRLRDK